MAGMKLKSDFKAGADDLLKGGMKFKASEDTKGFKFNK